MNCNLNELIIMLDIVLDEAQLSINKCYEVIGKLKELERDENNAKDNRK